MHGRKELSENADGSLPAYRLGGPYGWEHDTGEDTEERKGKQQDGHLGQTPGHADSLRSEAMGGRTDHGRGEAWPAVRLKGPKDRGS
ncbi:hypothetical protein EDD90_10946 [Streptomyces sp. Ag109_O5-1]|nr:hypothetical protein EDD90_10946 [Streptomyces sp. Ag109_O5-1]